LNISATAITIGIFLLPFAISFADRSSPHRHWHRVDEVLAERFTFALLVLLFAFWLGIRREALRLSAAPTATDAGPEPVLATSTDTLRSTSAR
jgi:hypothetical protein